VIVCVYQHRYALAAIALRRAGAGGRGPHLHEHQGRRAPIGELPAIDVAAEAAGGAEQRRRHEIDHPTPDANTVGAALGLHRRRRFARIAGECARIEIAHIAGPRWAARSVAMRETAVWKTRKLATDLRQFAKKVWLRG
jgi:hypothetical protein